MITLACTMGLGTKGTVHRRFRSALSQLTIAERDAAASSAVGKPQVTVLRRKSDEASAIHQKPGLIAFQTVFQTVCLIIIYLFKTHIC